MNIQTLVLVIGIIALLLTLLIGFVMKGHKNWLMTFLQNFCGVLFIISGWVKAIDPLGTAYKMEQYFDEFYSTLEGTWVGFIAPVFPWFSEHAIVFSLAMIIFEIVLGIMLLIGARPKFTAWAFLLLVALFTVLTGFTYLTGYVPEGVNFFSFGKWGAYDANNMKVTDCGCFGDFIKLEPGTSFMKDIVLLFPSLYFVFRHKDMHKLFTPMIRNGVVVLSTIGLLVYCMSNYAWDLPDIDFRPFKKNADIRAIKEQEADAMGNVQIVAWQLKNNDSGEVSVVPNDEYMGNYTNYRGKYEVLEQIKSEPAIKPTKISDFEITDVEGNDMTDALLEDPNAWIMLVAHKLYGHPQRATRTVQDSIFNIDTVTILDVNDPKAEPEIQIVKSLKELSEREETYVEYNWKPSYIAKYGDKVKSFVEMARAKGIPVLLVIGGSDATAIDDFSQNIGLEIEYGMADDILLKTIVRSNPGIVLWKDGKILDKWHLRKLPSFDSLDGRY